MNVNHYFVKLDLDCSGLFLIFFIFSEISCIKLSSSFNVKKRQNMAHCPALPYIFIKKFLCVPCEFEFYLRSNVVFLFSFFVSVTSLQPMEPGYSKEIFVDQEAAKQYICEICSNVLKNAIQIHDVRDEKRTCSECYKLKQK